MKRKENQFNDVISGPLATGAAWNDFLNLLEKLCLFKHLIFLDTISGDKDVIKQKIINSWNYTWCLKM